MGGEGVHYGVNTTMSLDLSGVSYECTCTGAACDTVPNTCGVHVHVGVACDAVGAHYFGGNVTVDPWTGANGASYLTVKDETTVSVPSTLNAWTGYNLTDMVNKTLVVHD